MAVIGPVMGMECTQEQATQLAYHLGEEKKPHNVHTLRRAINAVPTCPVGQQKKHLVFLNYVLNAQEDCIPEQVSFQWPVAYPGELEKSIVFPEEMSLEVPRDMESRLLTMIRWGQTEDLTLYCNEIIFAIPSQPDVSLQMEREYIVGANLLMSRVADASGVNAALLDELMENNLSQIEACKTRSELSCLFFQFAMEYAKQVKAVRSVSGEKPLTFRVNSFIRAHIYEKLTTSMVAAGLNYSVSHLCAAFKQENGVTLTDYIQQEKMAQARYLLEQDKKPAEVSRLLEFSSPSYFGVVFRRLVGMSPGEYIDRVRRNFQPEERPLG